MAIACSVYYKTYWQQSFACDMSSDSTVTVPQSSPFKEKCKKQVVNPNPRKVE